MSAASHLSVIRDILQNLNEKDLYAPLKELYTSKGYQARVVHGPHERGKDLIATKVNDYNILISVKKGNLNKKRWDSEVSSSIEQMIKRPINYSGVDENLDKKILLVLTGSLTPAVAELILETSTWNKEHGLSTVEVWDLETLTNEIYDNLLDINLVGNDYYTEIQTIILQITNSSWSKELMINFIDKYYALDFKNYSRANMIKILFLYLIKKSKTVENIYSFFFFAEYFIIKIWQHMYQKKDFSEISLIDEVHSIYLDQIKDWIEDLDYNVNGLFNNENTNDLNELFCYPLRSFDALRRIAYVCYVLILQGKYEVAKTYAEKIIRLLENNKSCSSPICEFNYTDIGLVLYVLKRLNYKIEARSWLFQIMEFVLLHYSLGYELLPLDKPLEDCPQFLNFDRASRAVNIESHILGLLFEFILILDAKEIFDTFRSSIPLKVNISHIRTTSEQQIYIPDFIHATTVSILIPELTYEFFKKKHRERLQVLYSSDIELSLIQNQRPNILLLIANHFRDRYFSVLWRNDILTS